MQKHRCRITEQRRIPCGNIAKAGNEQIIQHDIKYCSANRRDCNEAVCAVVYLHIHKQRVSEEEKHAHCNRYHTPSRFTVLRRRQESHRLRCNPDNTYVTQQNKQQKQPGNAADSFTSVVFHLVIRPRNKRAVDTGADNGHQQTSRMCHTVNRRIRRPFIIIDHQLIRLIQEHQRQIVRNQRQRSKKCWLPPFEVSEQLAPPAELPEHTDCDYDWDHSIRNNSCFSFVFGENYEDRAANGIQHRHRKRQTHNSSIVEFKTSASHPKAYK